MLRPNSIPYFCVIVVAVCLPAIANAQSEIGHVLDVQGNWYLNATPQQALFMGQKIPANGVIRSEAPSRYDRIALRYCNNQLLIRSCRIAGECDQPILLPRSVRCQRSRVERVVDGLMSYLGFSSIRAGVNAARSPFGKLNEAVVPLTRHTVDLAPVFAEMDPGNYHIVLEARTAEGKPIADRPARRLQVKRGSAGSPVTVPELEAGLYHLELLEQRGDKYLASGVTAWFLLSHPAQYQQSSDLFREVTRLTSTWRETLDEPTIRNYSRALLLHLASGAATSTKDK